MQQYLEAGKVVTTHGVRGEMKLELWCDGVNFLKRWAGCTPRHRAAGPIRSCPSAHRVRWLCCSWKAWTIWMLPVRCGAGVLL